MSHSPEGDELVEADDDAFHIGDSLDAPRAMRYTTRQLHTAIHEGDIDLSPPYQREVVWTSKQQSKILDSIFRNIYVPPIIFALYEDEDGNTVKKCVDGKQRLTAISSFYDGMIPYIDPVTKKQWYYTRAEKTNRKQVPEEWKARFREKEITCVEYAQLSDFEERDVFQRVQLGKPLEAAEKLQAISSPRADLVHYLDSRYFVPLDGLTQSININLRRGKNFQLLARLAFYCAQIPKQTFASHPKLEAWVIDPSPVSAELKDRIGAMLGDLRHISGNQKFAAGFTEIQARVSPAEFVFIGVLLFVLQSESKRNRAQEILQLRTYIRERWADIRHRADIIHDLWLFIEDASRRYETGIEWDTTDGKSKRKGKRKQQDIEDEDEDDSYTGGGSSRGKTKAGKK